MKEKKNKSKKHNQVINKSLDFPTKIIIEFQVPILKK